MYIDKACADAVIMAFKDEVCGDIIDGEFEKALAMGSEVSLVIDGTNNGVFKARFAVGQGGESFDVECAIGKGLAVAVKTSVGTLVDEEFPRSCSSY